MKEAIRVYETGIDDNRDRHCDLCGWFVNEYERHRARLMHSEGARAEKLDWLLTDFHLEEMSAEMFSTIFIRDNPYSRRDWNSREYIPIWTYSQNLPDFFSCPAINNYLRYGIVPDGFATSRLDCRVQEMNLLIGRFVVNKPITLYRGMHFNPGDAYLGFLDDAFKAMKTTGKPVEFVEKGFMSTSRSLETAKSYALTTDSTQCHVYMSVTLEKGVAAMPLSHTRGTTAKKNDKEVLLQSGGTYYIIGMDIEPRGNGLRDYYVNLLATNRRI